jgi:hypothetical protein
MCWWSDQASGSREAAEELPEPVLKKRGWWWDWLPLLRSAEQRLVEEL